MQREMWPWVPGLGLSPLPGMTESHHSYSTRSGKALYAASWRRR
jgi:hypothetical protein